MKKADKFLNIAKSVSTAVEKNKKVVALESTIISHGMPYPQNVETALAVEEVVRENGATPATIAVIDGILKVGLSENEIERLGKEGKNVPKLSRKDLPLALASGGNGATTVAATAFGAKEAGIHVFATGGIGGVHRGASETFDVSADLYELARLPVAVVCAGAKSILDIPATLELLESLSIPVLGYNVEEFPAFYCRNSGYKVQHKMRGAEEIRCFLNFHWQTGGGSGAIIANPIPQEYAMDEEQMEKVICAALLEANKTRVRGKEVTPFLLGAIVKATGGASLEANIALVKNNAKVAARIA